MPVQAPLPARIDQSISAEGLQHQVPTRTFAAGRQTFGPKLSQSQFFVKLAGQPTGSPLAWVTQLQFRKFDPHDVGVFDLHDVVFGKQSHRARQRLAVLKNLDGLLPGRLLLVVDLAQVENVALDDFAARATLVFHDRPVAVFLAIFLSRAPTQKHNGS